MYIKSFVFNPFYENTYVLWDDSRYGVIVDPGCYEKFECDELISWVKNENLTIMGVVNTHCHIDHVLGNYPITKAFGCHLLIPKDEEESLRAVTAYAPNWGIQHYSHAEPDRLLQNTGTLNFGKTKLEVIHAPGHSPGHLVFFHRADKKLIGGDVLFRESIGRSDLPGGDHETLLDSIRSKLYTLPDDTEVFPGHGPSTTIGHEKKNNPFVKA